jgi:hypothetical protein
MWGRIELSATIEAGRLCCFQSEESVDHLSRRHSSYCRVLNCSL